MPSLTLVTKILALLGTILAWFPILAPILLSALISLHERRFLFDYLMPAEFFPFALAGGLLLVIAALRAKSRRGLIIGGLAAAVVFLFGAQAVAIVTRLASGETAMGGWEFMLVLAMFAVYALAVVAVAVGGVLLLRDLNKAKRVNGDQ